MIACYRCLLLFILMFGKGFSAPCLDWVVYSRDFDSNLRSEIIRNYHFHFPEHLQSAKTKNHYCSSKWRLEGTISWNDFRVPAVNSDFGVIGSPSRLFSQLAELNFMIYDMQTPEREPEHIIIEYWVDNQWDRISDILTSLNKSLHGQINRTIESLRPIDQFKSRFNSQSPTLSEFNSKQLHKLN